jgi:hypothetical protein
VTNGRTATDEFVWREFMSPEHLGEARMAAMRRFLAGISRRGRRRHVTSTGYSPLGFCGGEFDLALWSHILFTYSDQLSVDFRVATIEEMCRVAAEARVFPLLKSYGGPSPYLKPVVDLL